MATNMLWMVGVLYVILQLNIQYVSGALIGCADEANFQACKSIELSLLQGCGTVDYTCQCSAQRLIRQCYNLCPEYSTDADTQSRVAEGICSSIPKPSIAPLPTGSRLSLPTSVAPAVATVAATTTAAPLPSTSQQAASTSSANHKNNPSTTLLNSFMCLFVFITYFAYVH
ncbi:MAG: hypothetical protein EXX96DRAFT_590715 [Benjaminiella poitrasii]|nr:MAG: hypothetical protein EXX96DRAFT_590715 [Benjaminiella poitrasii]